MLCPAVRVSLGNLGKAIMIRKFILAVTVVFITTFTLASCATLESAPAKVAARADTKSEAGGGRKGIETGELNQKVDACTDFYEFANGTWRHENPIPATMQRWSRRVAARDTNQQQVLNILEQLSQASPALKTGIQGLGKDTLRSLEGPPP